MIHVLAEVEKNIKNVVEDNQILNVKWAKAHMLWPFFYIMTKMRKCDMIYSIKM